MITDTSTEIKDREEAHLEQTLTASKLAVSALSHEIRNIATAISGVVYQMASSSASPKEIKHLDALRQLVVALGRLASQEITTSGQSLRAIRLDDFLRNLYVILLASLRDAGVRLEWQVEKVLPKVWADRDSLLQVFLNLTRNAVSAVSGRDDAVFRVFFFRTEAGVSVRVSDNGPGIKDAEYLFRPFNSERGPSGLGLYLSRAMMRSMQGDLQLESGHPGATFVIELTAAGGD
jgi:two-component system, LuxR family, sensor kinase FixL